MKSPFWKHMMVEIERQFIVCMIRLTSGNNQADIIHNLLYQMRVKKFPALFIVDLMSK